VCWSCKCTFCRHGIRVLCRTVDPLYIYFNHIQTQVGTYHKTVNKSTFPHQTHLTSTISRAERLTEYARDPAPGGEPLSRSMTARRIQHRIPNVDSTTLFAVVICHRSVNLAFPYFSTPWDVFLRLFSRYFQFHSLTVSR